MVASNAVKEDSDLTGRRFGRFTVLCKAAKRSGRTYWRCRCDCGNEREVEDWRLRSGHTKSCGCLRRDVLSARSLDLTGERFGRLRVIGPAEDPGKEGGTGKDGAGVWWNCICDCGKRCVCHKERLRNGTTRSCGCLQSEQRLANMETGIHFVGGTCVERLASKKPSSNNTSGRRGVYRRENGKWRAMIGFRGKVINLGTFENFEDAAKAREAAEEKYYTPFLESMGNGRPPEVN